MPTQVLIPANETSSSHDPSSREALAPRQGKDHTVKYMCSWCLCMDDCPRNIPVEPEPAYSVTSCKWRCRQGLVCMLQPEVLQAASPSGIVVEMECLPFAPCLNTSGLPFPETMLATDQRYLTVYNLTLSGVGTDHLPRCEEGCSALLEAWSESAPRPRSHQAAPPWRNQQTA